MYQGFLKDFHSWSAECTDWELKDFYANAILKSFASIIAIPRYLPNAEQRLYRLSTTYK